MCGFLFYKSESLSIDNESLYSCFDSFSWRGPDNSSVIEIEERGVFLGHHRLSILDASELANQPMLLSDKESFILFNGEIYNHLELRAELGLQCKTMSDTETLGEAYLLLGDEVFSRLNGMFSVFIYNKNSDDWVLARDAFGIKPLFFYSGPKGEAIASEASAIAKIISAPYCEESIREWEVIRRPVPGFSFFEGVYEALPGQIIKSSGEKKIFWSWQDQESSFNQQAFESLLLNSIRKHELNDFSTVSLLSGGLDSAIITSLAKTVKKSYTVGLINDNESVPAKITAKEIGASLKSFEFKPDEVKTAWRELTKLKGEPISVPNEALIYLVCQKMLPSEKVILTGEGADEILFGYDRLFRWGLTLNYLNYNEFMAQYGYSSNVRSNRLEGFFADLVFGKKAVDALEDFFLRVHLPGLLRRMDFASMAASKEARVPFVEKHLIAYLYRKPATIKIDSNVSKIPVRTLAGSLGIKNSLKVQKVGFSTKLTTNSSRLGDYEVFQSVIKEALGW
ncbi:asparagine synthetase B family protein [Marinobacter sp. CA1]|uniref:asparagine synthetase B family protein n=1 Tax=Marinobacter sp. CA1 TaxID=2817656 RepID=UPI001D069750|nr:asparagine synthase-related protein [Marinobacter sp. CA1]UDL03852.1 hypothetical protein J2887_14135 [Marinobacter sp. CA1]